MSKRNYNVFFNTHTVSGIVVSIALYVIFLAGAFALFRPEITAWENGIHSKHIERKKVDYDFLIDHVAEKNHLKSRDLKFYLDGEANNMYLLMSPVKDTIDVPSEAKFRYYESLDLETVETSTYVEKYSYGEFLYRLHFFSQIPSIGIYLAGIVAIFFLFAIVTGVIVHWKKMMSNFYQFNPKSSLKRVWADAHTALGFIGLPFQFIYAITGAYFGLSVLVLLPANFLYNGDKDQLQNDLRPDRKTYEWIGELESEMPSVNTFVKNNYEKWSGFEPHYLMIKNYGGSNMRYELIGELNDKEKFISSGIVSFDVAAKTTHEILNPTEINYLSDIQKSIGRLHFASFGGHWVKIVYFLLALITCFVIITGVLIWIEARNKKKMTLKQRKFTARVGHVYLGISHSFLPVIALFFIVVKILPTAYQTQKMTVLYNSFFWVWLAMSILFYLKKDNYFINKVSTLLVAFFGFLIPIVNGIVSGNWIWETIAHHQYEILRIDLLWISLATIALFVYRKIGAKENMQSTFIKNPIEG